MKVLFNTFPMAFDVPGGGEMQLMAYARHLPALGVEPTLFNLWNPDLRSHQLVHFFSVIGGSSHFCHYIKQQNLPLIVTSSLWVTDDTKHLYPMEEIRLQLDLADTVIANSNIEGDELARIFDLPREKFATVYNAVEESFLTPVSGDAFRSKLPFSNDFILNVGNIEPRKNQLALIRACKDIPDKKLVLIGHIRNQAYAEQCFAEGGSQVHYFGALPHDASLLKSTMSACALFVIPSTLETPSLAALEAAAQGSKIAITEVGSTREYFGDLVTYMNPADVESIRSSILTELTKHHQPELLRQLIADRFTWPKVLPSLVESYYKALKP